MRIEIRANQETERTTFSPSLIAHAGTGSAAGSGGMSSSRAVQIDLLDCGGWQAGVENTQAQHKEETNRSDTDRAP